MTKRLWMFALQQIKMVNLLIFLACKAHAIWRMEVPMAISVAKIDFINEETHRKWSIHTEVVILVADMHMLHIQLDAIEEISDKGKADRFIELTDLSFVPLLHLLHPLVTLQLLRTFCLLGLFSLFTTFLFALLVSFTLLFTHFFVHDCSIDQRVIAVISCVNVPSIVILSR